MTYSSSNSPGNFTANKIVNIATQKIEVSEDPALTSAPKSSRTGADRTIDDVAVEHRSCLDVGKAMVRSGSTPNCLAWL
jgi:hypothetical protein